MEREENKAKKERKKTAERVQKETEKIRRMKEGEMIKEKKKEI